MALLPPLTKDCDRWVQLSLCVEEWHVIHLGEGFIGVGVTRRPLQPRPRPDGGVPADNTGIFSFEVR